MGEPLNCPRCIPGKVLTLGGETTCVNCGWRPAPQVSEEVLEEGVGDAYTIYALVPSEEGLTLTRGAVFSYYEFKQPLSERLTDEAWQAMDPKPARPAWTSSVER